MSLSQAEIFRQLPREEREERLKQLTQAQLAELHYNWAFWARPEQLAPPGDWRIWTILAGRGFGKTAAGAQWCRQKSKEVPYLAIAGATADDVRDIMIEGPSGILAVCPKHERPTYIKHARKLVWPSGCVSLTFTAEEPDRARGKQHGAFWGDEVASWANPMDLYDQLMLGLRLGQSPQAVLTSTPRPIKLIKDLLKDPNCIVTKGKTMDNQANLAPQFISQLIKKYEGTRLGRQELEAEVLSDAPGALWKLDMIERNRLEASHRPKFRRILVAVDPSVSDNENPEASAEAGIMVGGLGQDGHGYLIKDSSLHGKPIEWGRVVIKEYREFGCDRVVAETNNGGALVEAVLRSIDPSVPYKGVHASRNKVARAEPVAALQEQNRIKMLGHFPKLEDQLTSFDPLTAKKSPDRLDAYVWLFTELMLGDAKVSDVLPESGLKAYVPPVAAPHKRLPEFTETVVGLWASPLGERFGLCKVGVFDPGNPTGIVLGLAEVTGLADLQARLKEFRSAPTPTRILVQESSKHGWLRKWLQQQGAPVRTVVYDEHAGPAAALALVAEGGLMKTDDSWADQAAWHLSRYPHEDSMIQVHAVSLAMSQVSRRRRFASPGKDLWYDAPTGTAESGAVRIYG